MGVLNFFMMPETPQDAILEIVKQNKALIKDPGNDAIPKDVQMAIVISEQSSEVRKGKDDGK